MNQEYFSTKIIATLGPSTDDIMEKLVMSGVSIARLNMSHGMLEKQHQRLLAFREAAKKLDKPVGVMLDLQGPKIRIGCFKTGGVHLKKGQSFTLSLSCPSDQGDDTKIGIVDAFLIEDVTVGQQLLLDDGRICLEVTQKTKTDLITMVVDAGYLSNNKGVNLFGGGLSADAITERDWEHFELACQWGVDYVALSFVKSKKDVERVRERIQKTNSKMGIIAKIERKEAIEVLEEIIEVSDGIMIARGDLAVEVGESLVPVLQKKIIKMARSQSKPVIVATQMLESMIEQTVPTRAETSDVANAVLDGCDAIMMSAETAVGNHPGRVVDVAKRICLTVEGDMSRLDPPSQKRDHFDRYDEAIAMAAIYAANRLDIRAIVALTESGQTPLWMSRVRSDIPIYGLSRWQRTCGRMALFRGVIPILFNPENFPQHMISFHAMQQLKNNGYLKKGDYVIVTKGDAVGIHGRSNTMKIKQVE